MFELMRSNLTHVAVRHRMEFTDFADDVWCDLGARHGRRDRLRDAAVVRRMITTARGLPDFGNARTMRNSAEASITAAISRGEPLTVLPDDIPIPKR
jgi:hypothetical protein